MSIEYSASLHLLARDNAHAVEIVERLGIVMRSYLEDDVCGSLSVIRYNPEDDSEVEVEVSLDGTAE